MERKNNYEMAEAATGLQFQGNTNQDEMMDGQAKSNYRDWDTVQVSQWLSNQIKLPQYSEMFSKYYTLILIYR